MSRPGFPEGVAVAFTLAIVSSIIWFGLTSVFYFGFSLKALATILTTLYAFYLLKRAEQTPGKITGGLLLLTAIATCWLLQLPVLVFLTIHVALIWLIRSLFFHNSIVTSLLDAGLQILAALAALWAQHQTGSLLLTTWTYFLTQALFVLIRFGPGRYQPKSSAFGASPVTSTSSADIDKQFVNASRQAELALQKLFST